MAYTTVTLPPREVYRVQCHRCGHVWFYCPHIGKDHYYAQCSNCRTTVTLHLKKEKRNRSAKYGPKKGLSTLQTGPTRATNSEDQNAVVTDTTTQERDYTEHG